MSDIPWQHAVRLVEPYIVRISTPSGSGTGFLFAFFADKSSCAVATAAHVVAHAHSWQQPIRVQHHSSATEVFLKAEDRAIILDESLDTAAIVFDIGEVPVPDSLIDLTETGKYYRQGVELGWLGYPALSPKNLCFFLGTISAFLQKEEIYLVDGVAINGVSGGPAFLTDSSGKLALVGVVSAYVPNRATGESLPGLLMVSDVSQLQKVIATLASMEDAQKKQLPPEATAEVEAPELPSGA